MADGVARVIVTPAGDYVNFPVAPGDASGIVREFLRQAGAVPDTADLRVDGSTTPVDFVLAADPTNDIVLNEITLVMVANSITSGSGKFAGLGYLSNGLNAYFYDGASEIELGGLHENEDFMHFSSPGGYGFWALSKDQVLASQYINGAVVLEANTGQELRLRVADNLLSGIDYLKARVKGVKRGT